MEVGKDQGVGRAGNDAIKQAVGSAVERLLKETSKKYLGVDVVPDGLGQHAGTILDRFSKTASETLGGMRPGAKISDKAIQQGAYALAKAFLVDRQGDWKSVVGSLVQSAIGTPPEPASEELGRLIDKRPYLKQEKDGIRVVAPENHLLRELLRRVGIDDKQPVGGLVAAAIETCQQKFSDLVKHWGDAGSVIAQAGVETKRHSDKVIDTLLEGTAGPELAKSARRAQHVSNVTAKATDSYGAVPKTAVDEETSASNVKAREFAGTNPAMTYILNRSFKKETVAALPEGIAAPQAIISAAAKELGFSADKGRLEEAVAALAKAFEDPRFTTAQPTPFVALSGVLTALIQHAQNVAKTSRDPDARELYKNKQGRYEAILEKIQQLEVGLGRLGGVEKISPSLARSFETFVGYAAGELIGNALRIPDRERPKFTKIDALKRIANHVIQDIDAEGRNPIVKMAMRRADQALSAKMTLTELVDLSNPAESAKKITAQIFGNVDPAKAGEAPQKLAKTLEAIIRDKQPKNNVELIMHVATALGEAGVPPEHLSPLLWPTVDVQQQFKDMYLQVAQWEGGLWQRRESRGGLTQEIEKLEKEIAGYEKTLESKPDDQDAKDFLARARGNLETAKGNLKDLDDQIQAYEQRIGQAKEQLEETPEVTNQLVEKAVSNLAAFLARPEETKKGLEEESKRFEEAWGGSGRTPPPGYGFQAGESPEEPDPKKADESDPAGKADPSDPNKPNRPVGKDDNDVEYTPGQLRAMECAAILNDPSLSIQDKVFLFMLVFSAYSDKEREDKLRELVKLDERQADWDKQRRKLGRTKDALIQEHSQIVEKINGQEGAIGELKKQGIAEDSTHPDMLAAKRELEKLSQDKSRVKQNIERTTEEYDKIGADSKQAPRTREVLFAEIEKITKFRDQMINMARSVIEDANRLIERIFR